MGGRIHGNLSTDDQCIEGVTNNGGIQEADNDLTDNGGPGPSPTGSVDVAQFPATAPGLGTWR